MKKILAITLLLTTAAVHAQLKITEQTHNAQVKTFRKAASHALMKIEDLQSEAKGGDPQGDAVVKAATADMRGAVVGVKQHVTMFNEIDFRSLVCLNNAQQKELKNDVSFNDSMGEIEKLSTNMTHSKSYIDAMKNIVKITYNTGVTLLKQCVQPDEMTRYKNILTESYNASMHALNQVPQIMSASKMKK